MNLAMPIFHNLRTPLAGGLKINRDILVLAGLFVTSFLFLTVGFIFFEIRSVNFPSAIILHFDYFQGVNFISDVNWVYRTVFLALLIQVINFVLAWLLKTREVFLAYMFAIFTLLISGLIFVALLVIISVN